MAREGIRAVSSTMQLRVVSDYRPKTEYLKVDCCAGVFRSFGYPALSRILWETNYTDMNIFFPEDAERKGRLHGACEHHWACCRCRWLEMAV